MNSIPSTDAQLGYAYFHDQHVLGLDLAFAPDLTLTVRLQYDHYPGQPPRLGLLTFRGITALRGGDWSYLDGIPPDAAEIYAFNYEQREGLLRGSFEFIFDHGPGWQFFVDCREISFTLGGEPVRTVMATQVRQGEAGKEVEAERSPGIDSEQSIALPTQPTSARVRAERVFSQLLDVCLQDEIDYLALKTSLTAYRTVLEELVGWSADNTDLRQDLHFTDGMALSTEFAARCIDDLIRTRQFLRGVFRAVTDRLGQRGGAVHLLYAGTGPFATLVLPLLYRFSSEELQLHLLEINPDTVELLRRLIDRLGIEDYVGNLFVENASTWVLPSDLPCDIVLSETMQQALVKEQQVPITLNLLSQLPEAVILIPQSIDLTLALRNRDTQLILTGRTDEIHRPLADLLTFDAPFCRAYLHHHPEWKKNTRFPLLSNFDLRTAADDDYDQLVVLTRIHTYGGNYVEVDQSSLTIPWIMGGVRSGKPCGIKQLDYVVGARPGFELNWGE